MKELKPANTRRIRRVRFTTVQIIALGFLGVIFAGALLLFLPFANREPIAFADALFMAVTCVCVTGLVTVTPAVQFTFAGKCIILVLIQIGGLGIIACSSAFILILHRRLSMKGRVRIQQAYGLESPAGMAAFIRRVLSGTFMMEGIGAVLFAFAFIPKYGLQKGLFYAIFHSVSAFCNAGVDLLGDASLTAYVCSPLVNFTVILLVVTGGLGFPVWHDLAAGLRKKLRGKERYPAKWLFTRLSLQSKIVLTMTLFLLLAGTIGFFLLEYTNPETFGELTLPQKFMAAFFQSVTCRTAGFASVSQAGLRRASRLLSCVLMFIGGSPAGTAGGIKTTTAAMMALTLASVLKGKKDTECFGRRVPESVVRSGVAISLITFTFWIVGAGILACLEPGVDFLDLLFETASAIATVGLTADLTPSLCRASQAVIMVMMYVGRIGPLTMGLLFAGRADRHAQFRDLPKKSVMIG